MSNSLIFAERETHLDEKEIEEKVEMFQRICETEEDDYGHDFLRQVVPIFKKPEEVSVKTSKSEELKN